MASSAPVLSVWIAAVPLVLAQGRAKPPAPAPFEGRLAQARELALERNVPILIATFYEGEDWSPKEHHDEVGLRRELFEDKEWAAQLERAILLLACNRVHERERVVVERDGQTVEVERCASMRSGDCASHQRLFEDVFGTWQDNGELRTPFVVVLRPDGTVENRWSDGHVPKREAILGALEAVRKAVGTGLDERELILVRSLEADARAAEARGVHGAAWRAWRALLETSQTTPASARARLGSAAAEQAVAQRRDAARAALDAGDAIAAWTALHGLVEECAQLPIQRELAAELRALENAPAHKAVLRAHARELEAAALLAEIDALVRQGDERKARARAAKLLRGLGDTRAAAEARARHPDLVD